jgi:5-hydroxyisourate hydrolase
MGRLTTHVLDTASGCPAGGVRIELFGGPDGVQRLATSITNDDGRCDAPLLEGDQLQTGTYQLVFYAGDYFAGLGINSPEPRFLDRVVIRFGVADAGEHYHVPLLISPFAYSTYRGS